MLRHLGPSDKRLTGQLIVIAALSLVSVFLVGRYAESAFLRTESRAASVRMAEFLRQNLSDLDGILTHGRLTVEDRALFRHAARMGGVFRYKLFSSDGRIVHASRPEDVGKRVTSPYFDSIVRRGQDYFNIAYRPIGTTAYTDELGTPYEEGVVLVSERYVPIMDGALFKGAIEVYIDMTPLFQRLRRTTLAALAGVLLLLTIVGLVCGIFIYRNLKDRRHRIDELKAARHEAEGLARQAEAMLKGLLVAEQEKMSRVINLAGGLAHEIGNPLATLSVNLDALEASSLAVPDTELPQRISDMRKVLSRLECFLRDITAFSDQNDDGTRDIDINEVIRGLAGLVQLDDRARKATFSLDLSPHIASLSLPHQRLSLALFILFSIAAEDLDGAAGRVEIGTSMLATGDGAEIRIVTSRPPQPGDSLIPAPTSLDISDHPALQTAMRLVDSFGGSMTVRSRQPAGKQLRLVLPQKIGGSGKPW